MGTINTIHPYRVDLEECPLAVQLTQPLSHQDALADVFSVAVRRGMKPIDLSGMTATAYLTFGDTRQTLPLSGTVNGSTASVTLTGDCYKLPGLFTLVLQLTDGDVRHTVLRVSGLIDRTACDDLLASGDLLPTLPELLEELGDMREATAAAQTAAGQARDAAAEARQAIAAFSADTAPAIVLDASDEVIVLEDAAARPALSLVSRITAVQSGSGDPSPENPRPISGWDTVTLTRTGRNMLDPTAVTQLTINTGETRWGVRYTQPGTYALSASVPGKGADYVYARLTDANGTAVGNTMYLVAGSTVRSCEVVLEAGQALTVWYVRDLDYDTVVDCLTRTQVQVEMNRRTAHAPPQRIALTAALPETVYGGSFNWTTGEMTVTHRCAQIADMRVKTVGVDASGTRYADLAYPENIAPRTNAASFSNAYRYITTSQTAVHGTYRVYNSSLTVYDDRFESVAAAQSILQGLGFAAVVEIPNSETAQLTPQQAPMLHACNTVWSDTGSTALSCVADTRLYIDNAIASIAASIINN